jgi:hypothetical protein
MLSIRIKKKKLKGASNDLFAGNSAAISKRFDQS